MATEDKRPEYETLQDELLDKRIILLDKEITTELAGEVAGRITLLDIKSLASKRKPILLLINSYGGDVNASLGLCDIIRNTSCPVITACMGIAQSGGSLILSAGYKRYAVSNAEIMIHQLQHNLEDFTQEELLNYAEASKHSQKRLIEYYLQVTKMEKRKIEQYLKKDTYISPKIALDFGIIDGIGWDVVNWLK